MPMEEWFLVKLEASACTFTEGSTPALVPFTF